MRKLLVLPILAVLIAAAIYFTGGGSQPLKATAAAPAYTPPSSIATDCSSDVTSALNAWFATVPDSSTIQFPANACYLVSSDLVLRDRNSLTIDGNGSTVELPASGAVANTQVFALDGGTNISLENMTIVGDNPSTAKGGNTATCQPSGGDEWEFGVAFNGVNTGSLTNVNVNHICGDFVDMEPYRNANKSYDFTRPATNITVTGGTFAVAGRQGFAPSDVEGLVVNGINMSHVAQDGIDLEPDTAAEFVNNINIENSTFFNISAAVVANFGTGGGPNDGNITVSNNTETGTINCYPPIWGGNSAHASTPRVGLTVTGNHFSPFGRMVNLQSGYSNVSITNNVDSGAQGNGGCGQPEGVLASGISGLTIENNNFGPTVSTVSTLDSTTTVTLSCGNTTSSGTNQPVDCVANPGCPPWSTTFDECLGEAYHFATTPGSFAAAENWLKAFQAYSQSLGDNGT